MLHRVDTSTSSPPLPHTAPNHVGIQLNTFSVARTRTNPSMHFLPVTCIPWKTGLAQNCIKSKSIILIELIFKLSMVVTLAIICVHATPLVFTSLAFVNACWNVKNALYLSIVSLRSQDPTDKVRHSPAVNKCQHSAFNINRCKSYNNCNCYSFF